MLLISAKSAAGGIEQKTLGLVHRILGKLLVFESRSPARHGRGDRFFRLSLMRRQGHLLYAAVSYQRSAVSKTYETCHLRPASCFHILRILERQKCHEIGVMNNECFE